MNSAVIFFEAERNLLGGACPIKVYALILHQSPYYSTRRNAYLFIS